MQVDAWQTRYKEKNGCLHPSQDPRHQAKYKRSASRVIYEAVSGQIFSFRSIMELSFALVLDHDGIRWTYESERIRYVDHITGRRRYYLIDFVTDDCWIEVKPNEKMIPSDKRLYAGRAAQRVGKKFRGVSREELDKGWMLICDGYRLAFYDFIRRKPRSNRKQITYYFKDKEELGCFELRGFCFHHRKQLAPHLHKLVMRRSDVSRPSKRGNSRMG